MHIEPFFDPSTSTLTDVVHDRRSGVVIDPVRDYDAASGRTSWASAGAAAAYIDGQRRVIPYGSIQRLYALPADTRLLVCHDYQPGGRALAFETTVAEQRRSNIQLRADTTKAELVALREARDAGLGAPALLLPSIQVDIRAGRLPEPEANGIA